VSNPEDIRNTQADKDYWPNFEKIWTSLLTYRYLGRLNPILDEGVSETTMPLRHDMRNRYGGIMAAPLAIAAAECGGMSDDLYIPNPLSASMQIIDNANGVKRVKVIPEVVKIGRSMGFSRSKIVDAHNESRVIALSSGSAISLGSPPAGYKKVHNPPIEVEDKPDMPQLHEVFGVVQIEHGVWQLPKIDSSTASPDAALHLGPQHIALEAAATQLAEAKADFKPQQVCQWQIAFVARGKVGPFRTQGQAYQSVAGGPVAVELLLLDCGNDHRPITMASALYQQTV